MRARRHISAWTLALAVCASVVVGRVLDEPDAATGQSQRDAPENVRTVTRTVTVTEPAPASTGAAMRTSFTVAGASAVTARARCKTRRQKRSKRCRKKRKPVVRTESVDGDSIATRYGPVQVRLRMRGNRIVDVIHLEFPYDIERTKQISDDCMPKLRQQVLAAQSARIDGVAGATYTADGYKKSVQSALDLS